MELTNDFEQQARLAALDAALKITSMIKDEVSLTEMLNGANKIKDWLLDQPKTQKSQD